MFIMVAKISILYLLLFTYSWMSGNAEHVCVNRDAGLNNEKTVGAAGGQIGNTVGLSADQYVTVLSKLTAKMYDLTCQVKRIYSSTNKQSAQVTQQLMKSVTTAVWQTSSEITRQISAIQKTTKYISSEVFVSVMKAAYSFTTAISQVSALTSKSNAQILKITSTMMQISLDSVQVFYNQSIKTTTGVSTEYIHIFQQVSTMVTNANIMIGRVCETDSQTNGIASSSYNAAVINISETKAILYAIQNTFSEVVQIVSTMYQKVPEISHQAFNAIKVQITTTQSMITETVTIVNKLTCVQGHAVSIPNHYFDGATTQIANQMPLLKKTIAACYSVSKVSKVSIYYISRLSVILVKSNEILGYSLKVTGVASSTVKTSMWVINSTLKTIQTIGVSKISDTVPVPGGINAPKKNGMVSKTYGTSKTAAKTKKGVLKSNGLEVNALQGAILQKSEGIMTQQQTNSNVLQAAGSVPKLKIPATETVGTVPKMCGSAPIANVDQSATSLTQLSETMYSLTCQVRQLYSVTNKQSVQITTELKSVASAITDISSKITVVMSNIQSQIQNTEYVSQVVFMKIVTAASKCTASLSQVSASVNDNVQVLSITTDTSQTSIKLVQMLYSLGAKSTVDMSKEYVSMINYMQTIIVNVNGVVAGVCKTTVSQTSGLASSDQSATVVYINEIKLIQYAAENMVFQTTKIMPSVTGKVSGISSQACNVLEEQGTVIESMFTVIAALNGATYGTILGQAASTSTYCDEAFQNIASQMYYLSKIITASISETDVSVSYISQLSEIMVQSEQVLELSAKATGTVDVTANTYLCTIRSSLQTMQATLANEQKMSAVVSNIGERVPQCMPVAGGSQLDTSKIGSNIGGLGQNTC